MLLSRSTLFVSILQLVAAQTPIGVTPVVLQTLNIAYGNNTVSPPGELIPRPETASPPALSSSVFSTTGRAIVFLIDQDVPRNGTRVSLLHWFAQDVTGVVNDRNSTTLTVPTTGPGAMYLQPSPPVGDSPHRYVLFLFQQPANFTIPAAFASINPPASSNDRIGFNLTAFVAATGLGAPLAANFITVQNTTGIASTTYPPSSFTTTAGSAGTATASATRTGASASSSSTSTTTANAAAKVAEGSGVALLMAAVYLFGQM